MEEASSESRKRCLQHIEMTMPTDCRAWPRATLELAPKRSSVRSDPDDRRVIGEHPSCVLRIFRSQLAKRPGTFLMPMHWKEVSFSSYEDVPELCPVFVELVDEKRYLGHC